MKTHFVQSNFLSGVLDPRAAARIDTQAYNDGMLEGVNIVPIHLGGVIRRGGTRYVTTLSNKLDPITGVSISAPNGGDGASAADRNVNTILTTTTPVGVIDPYVVVHYDFGKVVTADYVDVLDIVSTGGSSTLFCIQYSTDDTTWATLGDLFRTVDSDVSRSYRRYGGNISVPAPVSARYWRVAKVGGLDMGTHYISISGFNLWQNNSQISEVRLIQFEVSSSDRHVVALTDRSAVLYQDGFVVARIPTPYFDTDLASLDAANNAEELVIVGEKYPPMFILDESPDADNFQPFLLNFTKIPQIDFSDELSPTPTSEIQVFTFSSATVGEKFQISLGTIELGDAQTGEIVFAGDSTADERIATANNIAVAVQGIFVVKGFSGVTCARTGAFEYTVTLAGASAAPYTLGAVSAITGSMTAAVVRSQVGVSRSEDAWGVTRGYPRTVAFYGGRLFFGGTKSLQQTIFGSTVNDILNFATLKGLDDEAIEVTLDGSQGLNAINGLYAGRTLQIFTSGGEFVYQDNPIKPSVAPLVQTQYGSAKVRPVAIDGSTLYVQRNGKSVRDFRFEFQQQAYDSFGVSSLAAHLINDVVGMSAWNGSSHDEINLVFVWNGDGTMAVYNTRKEAQVQAWVQWTTQGLFKSVAAVAEDIYFAVRRTFPLGDGTTYDKLFLEKYDSMLHVDCGVTYTNSIHDPLGIISYFGVGAEFVGATLRVVGDGFVLPDVVVSPTGTIDLQGTTAGSAEIGLNFDPKVTPMPLNTLTPSGGPNFMSKRRVVKIRAKIRNTLGLLVNGQVIPDREFDRDHFDSSPASPTTRNIKREMTTNYDDDKDKTITFSQVDPLPMEILGFTAEIESSE